MERGPHRTNGWLNRGVTLGWAVAIGLVLWGQSVAGQGEGKLHTRMIGTAGNVQGAIASPTPTPELGREDRGNSGGPLGGTPAVPDEDETGVRIEPRERVFDLEVMDVSRPGEESPDKLRFLEDEDLLDLRGGEQGAVALAANAPAGTRRSRRRAK